MSKKSTLNNPVVTIVNNQAVTTSLAVAKYFGKRHKDVLRAIQNLDISADWLGRNFALKQNIVSISNGATRTSPYYEMTRDGFVILAMGFTGKEAMQFKIKYIDTFNAMDAYIKGQTQKGQLPMFPNAQLDAPLSRGQKDYLNALVGQWAIYASMGVSAVAWHKVHVHFGVKSINEYKASQFLEIKEWIQERAYIALKSRGRSMPIFEILDPRPLLANLTGIADDEDEVI